MADEKKKTPDAAEGGEEKKGGNLGLVIGIIVAIVLLQAAIAYLIIPKPVDEAALAEKRERDSLRLAAEEATRVGAFTVDAPINALVNIAGTNGERFLKASVILEYDEKNVPLGNAIRQRNNRYNDMFSAHLSNLTLMEVTEPLAREKIRADLLRMINTTLPPGIGEVQNVVFREFIIQ